jgi:hypothetical protein
MVLQAMLDSFAIVTALHLLQHTRGDVQGRDRLHAIGPVGRKVQACTHSQLQDAAARAQQQGTAQP